MRRTLVVAVFMAFRSDERATYSGVRTMLGKDARFSRRFPSQLQAIEIQR